MTGSTVARLAWPLDHAKLGPNTVATLAGVILFTSAFAATWKGKQQQHIKEIRSKWQIVELIIIINSYPRAFNNHTHTHTH